MNANAHGHIHELIGGSYNPNYDINGNTNNDKRQFRYKPPTSTTASTTTTATRRLSTDSIASKTTTTAASSATSSTTDTTDTATITTTDNTDSNTKNAYAFLHNTEAFSKILWRNDILLCPINCQLPLSSSSSSMNNNNINNADITTNYNNNNNNNENTVCRCQCTDKSKQNMSAATIFDKLKISPGLTYSFVSDGESVGQSFSNVDLIDTQTGKNKESAFILFVSMCNYCDCHY